jgi:hypothetical protein
MVPNKKDPGGHAELRTLRGFDKVLRGRGYLKKLRIDCANFSTCVGVWDPFVDLGGGGSRVISKSVFCGVALVSNIDIT